MSMTIQQLKYIVALDQSRNFVRASQLCKVAQPTLSAMVRKLEEELQVTIFDRARHPLEPTAVGRRIIAQARTALNDVTILHEIVSSEVASLAGRLSLGVIPTIAPYLVPGFIRTFRADYASVEVSVSEMLTCSIVPSLLDGSLDMAVAATPLGRDDLLEIPVYYERFAAYFSPEAGVPDGPLGADALPAEGLWVLQDGHCLRSQVFNFCGRPPGARGVYEAGSIDTLVRIVDGNGGYTVIPELHLGFLSERQRRGVRPIDAPPAVREVSLVVRRDYVRERLLNAVADAIKRIIPEHMLDGHLKKFAIRL